MLKANFVFGITEVWIWRDRRPEASCETEEGRVRKPSSCIHASHSCLWGQGRKRGGENCCRIGGTVSYNIGFCITLILSYVGYSMTAAFLTFVFHSVCHWLLLTHILSSRHAHYHYHMFKQQVPYVPLPLALGEPRDHIMLSHTHHHPRLTDHSQTDGPWLLLRLCLKWSAWNTSQQKT